MGTAIGIMRGPPYPLMALTVPIMIPVPKVPYTPLMKTFQIPYHLYLPHTDLTCGMGEGEIDVLGYGLHGVCLTVYMGIPNPPITMIY